LCIYNVSLVLLFIIPLLSSSIGDRHATSLLRAFAVMFISLSTVLTLFVPKFLALKGIARVTPDPAKAAGAKIAEDRSAKKLPPSPRITVQRDPARRGSGSTAMTAERGSSASLAPSRALLSPPTNSTPQVFQSPVLLPPLAGPSIRLRQRASGSEAASLYVVQSPGATSPTAPDSSNDDQMGTPFGQEDATHLQVEGGYTMVEGVSQLPQQSILPGIVQEVRGETADSMAGSSLG
jgi:hypothetical protein